VKHMAKYASDTTVSPSRSRAEIEETLQRYGADGFAYATAEGRAMFAFKMYGKQARITVPLPRPEDYRLTDKGRLRTNESQLTAYKQAERQTWRVMLLLIKAKLEAIEAEVTTWEHEFFADMLLPSGQTVAEAMLPQVEECYKTGVIPTFMPMLTGAVGE
jgi:DNA-binding transcriptional regulator PaaX